MTDGTLKMGDTVRMGEPDTLSGGDLWTINQIEVRVSDTPVLPGAALRPQNGGLPRCGGEICAPAAKVQDLQTLMPQRRRPAEMGVEAEVRAINAQHWEPLPGTVEIRPILLWHAPKRQIPEKNGLLDACFCCQGCPEPGKGVFHCPAMRP